MEIENNCPLCKEAKLFEFEVLYELPDGAGGVTASLVRYPCCLKCEKLFVLTLANEGAKTARIVYYDVELTEGQYSDLIPHRSSPEVR